MIQISFTSSYERSFKKRIKGNPYLETQYAEKVKIFINDPFYPTLKTHKLKGELKDLWSFSIRPDVRIIFYFKDKHKVVFENIGSHDEVY